eukprot:m.202663 g.202663  ORF g.202663 m.202663 type:complete len:180 (+) comp53839_c0_seq5:758-1297(+)
MILLQTNMCACLWSGVLLIWLVVVQQCLFVLIIIIIMLHSRRFVGHRWSQFALICITELFDECLAIMRRKFNWSLADLPYLPQRDSQAGIVQRTGVSVMKTPSISDLPIDAQIALIAHLHLDMVFYELARQRFEEMMAALAHTHIEQEVQLIKSLNIQFAKACQVLPHDHPACHACENC